MNSPRLSERDDGGLVFDALAPWYLALLLELPELLAPEQPDEVQDRLLPLPSDDEEHREEWRKLVHPELFALLASAREIVQKDLASLAPSAGTGPTLWRLEIAPEHVPAWLSALNAARLALGARHGIEEADMDGRRGGDDEVPDERQIAVAKIHLYGLLQQMILEERHPPPDEGEE